MSLEPPLLSSEHFGYHHKSSTFNSLNKTGSDCDVDDKTSLGDKYLFPYTGTFCYEIFRLITVYLLCSALVIVNGSSQLLIL